MYETMRQAQPDVFINVGDTIYADQPLLPEVKLDDGSIWKNVVTAGEIEGGRDDGRVSAAVTSTTSPMSHMRRFIARGRRRSSMWDDHEVRDNWYWERRQGQRRALPGEVGGAARRARPAGVLRIQPAARVADDPERVYRIVPLGPACRCVRARHAQLQGRQQRQSPAGHGRSVGDLRRGAAATG